MDVAYQNIPYRLNEIQHRYGERVHILADPFAASLLTRLCSPETTQPEVNRLVRRLYEKLVESGIDTIIDDRDERPGVKFKDADLVGFPYRVTIGPKGLEQGVPQGVPHEQAEKY